MTFFSFLTENKTKILGTLTMVVGALLSMIATGLFGATADSPALLEPSTIRWLAIILSLLNVALGGGTVAAGIQNTTRERVAEAAATVAVAKAETAQAMTTALLTPPPEISSPQGRNV